MIADIDVVVKKIRESSNAFKKVTATDVVNFTDIKASDEDKKNSARSIRKFRCFQGNLMDNLVQAHETMQLDSDLYLLQPYEVVRSNVSSITHNCFLFFLINKVLHWIWDKF